MVLTEEEKKEKARIRLEAIHKMQEETIQKKKEADEAAAAAEALKPVKNKFSDMSDTRKNIVFGENYVVLPSKATPKKVLSEEEKKQRAQEKLEALKAMQEETMKKEYSEELKRRLETPVVTRVPYVPPPKKPRVYRLSAEERREEARIKLESIRNSQDETLRNPRQFSSENGGEEFNEVEKKAIMIAKLEAELAVKAMMKAQKKDKVTKEVKVKAQEKSKSTKI